MSNSDYEQVVDCMRRIAAVIHAHDDRDAESACSRLLVGGADREVVFAAVQGMRDLEAITEMEAVFLFHVLFEATVDDLGERGAQDEAYLEAKFLRARGESYLAYLRLADASTYEQWCDDGQFAFVDDRRAPDVRLAHEPNEAAVDMLVRRLTRTVADARGNGAELYLRLMWLADGVPAHLVRSAVRAAAACRDRHILSDDDALSVIRMLLAPVVSGLLRGDRVWQQVQMEIARHAGKRTPAELVACERRRWQRMWVHCLRVCGEQEWAEAELRGGYASFETKEHDSRRAA